MQLNKVGESSVLITSAETVEEPLSVQIFTAFPLNTPRLSVRLFTISRTSSDGGTFLVGLLTLQAGHVGLALSPIQLSQPGDFSVEGPGWTDLTQGLLWQPAPDLQSALKGAATRKRK